MSSVSSEVPLPEEEERVLFEVAPGDYAHALDLIKKAPTEPLPERLIQAAAHYKQMLQRRREPRNLDVPNH